MEQVQFTKVDYTSYSDIDTKFISNYEVERTQKQLLDKIETCDVALFIAQRLQVKLNKNGSFPKKINEKSFYLATDIPSTDYYFNWRKNNYVEVNILIEHTPRSERKWYSVSINCNDIYGCCVSDQHVLASNILGCISAQVKSRAKYIDQLKSIPSIVNSLESINYHGLSPWMVKQWM